MATTLNTLAHYLDQRQWRYQVDAAASRIVTGVQSTHLENFLIVLQLSEGGAFFQLQAPQILMVPDHVFKGVMLQTMAHIQYQVKMLRLEYDPMDGEVRASIELPLEDAVLTERQFNRCLDELVYWVDNEVMPRLQSVLATGEDPRQAAIIAQMAETMPPNMMALMTQVVAFHQQRSQNGNF